MPDFKPKDNQPEMIDWMTSNRRCGVWAPMGGGKSGSTLFALETLNLVEDVYPALILGPLRVCNSTWPAEVRKFSNFEHLRVSPIAWRDGPKKSATAKERLARLRTPADIYTLPYGSLTWLMEALDGEWPFRTLIADECFVAGTAIATPDGDRAIETLRRGDAVLTHAGPRKVVRAQRRLTDAFNLVCLKLSNGSQIHATRDHPLFTDAGWLPAGACGGRRLYGRDCLSELSDALQTRTYEGAGAGAQTPLAVLQHGVSYAGALQPETGAARAGSPDDGGIERGADDVLELWETMVRSPSGECLGGACGQAIPGPARWERHWDVQNGGADSADAARRLLVELHRSVGRCWAGLSIALQARLRRSTAGGMSGGGWSLPPYGVGPGAGRAKDGAVTVVGVESAPHHERGRMVSVFNLEVEGAPTYFAGGVLAHNCTRLKSFRLRQGGANAGALRKVAHETNRFIGLTGTPATNGLKDLWGQLWFVDKGERLGKSFSAFEMRWFHKDRSGFGMVPYPHSADEIYAALTDVCRTIEGPPVDEAIVSPIYIDLPPKARDLYRQMEKLAFAEIKDIGVEAVNAAVKTNKLLQIASGCIFHDDGWEPVHDAKLEALESVIEEANGAPVLVQYNYKPDLERILKHFRQARHLDADPDTERRWNAGEIPILVAHGASAGHGLNLQDGGHILARYSFDWNLEYYMQILERIGPLRQKQSGHDRRVYDYPILARGTFDEDVFTRHKDKLSVQQMLLNAMLKKETE